jgi:hypothetical protein
MQTSIKLASTSRKSTKKAVSDGDNPKPEIRVPVEVGSPKKKRAGCDTFASFNAVLRFQISLSRTSIGFPVSDFVLK